MLFFNHETFVEASASKLKRLTHSAVQECPATFGKTASLLQAGKVTKDNLKNAERDLHRLFRKLGLGLPLSPWTWRFGLLHVHHLRLSDWFKYLIRMHPDYLLLVEKNQLISVTC